MEKETYKKAKEILEKFAEVGAVCLVSVCVMSLSDRGWCSVSCQCVCVM